MFEPCSGLFRWFVGKPIPITLFFCLGKNRYSNYTQEPRTPDTISLSTKVGCTLFGWSRSLNKDTTGLAAHCLWEHVGYFLDYNEHFPSHEHEWNMQFSFRCWPMPFIRLSVFKGFPLQKKSRTDVKLVYICHIWI